MVWGPRLLAGGFVVAVAACGWLYRENRDLRNRLDALIVPAQPPGIPSSPLDATPGPAPDRRQGGDRASRAPWRFADTTRPALAPAPEETRAERRRRREGEIAAMLGRLEGESVEAYRARMVPFVTTALVLPRQRVRDARRQAEDAAGVTDAQRAALDATFDDAYSEVLALTNRAIADGELTPYARNWSGMLGYAGGMGAILGDAEARIAGILSPEQVRIIYEQGFEWGEYIGVSAPWEELDAPPPGGSP